ncbi:metalloregulator ArsR/SmtB family transcription factor [Proteiniborus sp. MB09-C3]|uniref:ArsR/SmtB family transcription factor n=1 Tax=Proteiniborus sp. MB09-C3 TaxID=3050072 RepID=UPI002554D9D5|nr:metalloregulator ArsR/SmtB family transcription factor [Proteiniborus sp. MB09-C3]WIV13744.1 metalloregulator ArsR/SmtB family transcription factor [Proteiniborus sp. MB09-C3]
MNYSIRNTPNWLFEAAACISEQYLNHEEKVIENHNKFGMTKEEMTVFFKNYKAYKKAVLEEITPICNNYSSLKWLFEPLKTETEEKDPIGLSIVTFWEDRISSDINEEEIDEFLDELISSIISEYTTDTEKKDLVIKSLSDLVNILDNDNIDDSFKMQLIKLYNNRYEVFGKLWEMLHLCIPICQKHFYIIKEDFERALESLEKIDDLGKFIDSSVAIKINTNLNYNIYLSILHFNGFRMELHSAMDYCYIGIYFFSLVDLKEKNRFNDSDMITDLKALSDVTRLKMIHILLEKNMYLQELAENLGLTPSTVSHHINILLKSELISITMVRDENTRKVFYEINRAKLESIGDSIKKLAAI